MILKVFVSYLLLEGVVENFADYQLQFHKVSTTMREDLRAFFLSAQGARFAFLQLLKVASQPFLSNLNKLWWGLYTWSGCRGKIKFHWGCGCLVVLKTLYGGLSEGPSIL